MINVGMLADPTYDHGDLASDAYAFEAAGRWLARAAECRFLVEPPG